MIPSSPLFASLLSFLCPPLLPLPLFLISVSLRFFTHYLAFVSSITVVEVDLHIYLVHSSHLLKVTVHTGVSVQRRDRCTGMQ